jgi:hypothetical protein
VTSGSSVSDKLRQLKDLVSKLRDLPPEAGSLALDVLQLCLDIGGVIEPTPFCDLSSGAVSAVRGNLGDAVLSVLGVLPLAGDLAKVGKLGKYAKSVAKAIELAKKDAQFAKLIRPFLQNLYDLLRRVPVDKLPAKLAKPLRKLKTDLGDFLGVAGKTLTGQIHHPISAKIARELDKHPILRGKYKARDSRFTTQAADKAVHNGYEKWHRQLDDEVVQWLRDHQQATEQQFENWLRWRYSRPDLKARFPKNF